MTYESALNYMESLGHFGMMLGLTRIEALLDTLGHPEERLKIIHLAGTNGKGSTGAFLAAILQAAGYKVGRFISPAVFEYRERIQMNGMYIPRDDFSRCVSEVKNACEQLVAAGLEQPTQFETDTAVAYVYFAHSGCDFVLLEVGLGGRNDATNAIRQSLMSVITSIGFDHTKVLGEHLWQIAGEKAGIIKPGQPAVTCAQPAEAMDEIRHWCQQVNASLTVCASAKTLSPADAKKIWNDEALQRFDYKDLKNLQIRLPGLYQIQNASLAVETALVMGRNKFAEISDTHIREGLLNARWPGRFEVLKQSPLLIADGAHNPDGAMALAVSLQTYFKDRRIILIMGVFADKDYQKILEIMASCADTLMVHCPPSARGLDAKSLADAAALHFKHVFAGKDIADCLQKAYEICQPEDVIVSFGSLSSIGRLHEICGCGDTQ